MSEKMITSKDRVVVGHDDQTHVVDRGIFAMFSKGRFRGEVRARCNTTSPNWLERVGDVVTCPECVRWLRRRALAFASRSVG